MSCSVIGTDIATFFSVRHLKRAEGFFALYTGVGASLCGRVVGGYASYAVSQVLLFALNWFIHFTLLVAVALFSVSCLVSVEIFGGFMAAN